MEEQLRSDTQQANDMGDASHYLKMVTLREELHLSERLFQEAYEKKAAESVLLIIIDW